jgi:Zn ribbon nucleic-acid-binding protein
MGRFMHHEPCPKCRSRDNLARYEDESAWCFGCGYYEKAKFRKPRSDKARLPFREFTTNLPEANRKWLRQYLNEDEIKLFQYDPESDRHVYVAGDFYEARSVTQTPKSLQYGKKPLHILGEGQPLVVVEDIVSAIKIARFTQAVPLWGSHMSRDWMAHIRGKAEKVMVWLDSDKYHEAVELAVALGSLGCLARVIRTDKDPKELTEAEILRKLT